MLFGAGAICAQDMHFSQALEHPSLVNPALTGATARMRASIANKSQWRTVTTPYRSMGASFEFGRTSRQRVSHAAGKFGTTRKKNSSRLAAGISVYRDRAGDGLLSLTQANLSIAAFVPTGKRSKLSLGMQASYSQRSLDQTAYVYPSQFSNTGYDNSMPSGEAVGDSYKYNDYAGGILWCYGQDEKTFVTHKELKAKIGAAVYHALEPGRQFVPARMEQLMRKYVAHGDVVFSLSTKMGLAPSFVYQLQGPSSELLAGAMFRYYFANASTGTRVTKYTGFVNRTVLSGGAFIRTGDAIIASFLFEWDEHYVVGISYDINYSQLMKATRLMGGLEFTLRYSLPGGFLYEKR
jgi:type IX secretion system PorP/SprF family membrane protein